MNIIKNITVQKNIVNINNEFLSDVHLSSEACPSQKPRLQRYSMSVHHQTWKIYTLLPLYGIINILKRNLYVKK